MFDDTVPRLRRMIMGAVCWTAAPIVFVVANLLAQAAWTTPYSWGDNNISNLGHVSCAWFKYLYVCSPRHAWMNAGFVVTGLLIVAGTMLTHRGWSPAWTARAAAVLVGGAGVGYVLVGCVPADVDLRLHLVGAKMILLLGNAGLLLAAGRHVRRRPIPILALALAILSSAAAVAHLSRHYAGLGPGGTERIAFAGPLVFLLVSSATLLRSRAEPVRQVRL